MHFKKVDKGIIFRKLIHALGAFILLIVKLFNLETAQAIIIILMLIYTGTEILRLSGKRIQPFTWIVTKSSTDEEQKYMVTTPLWYAVGVLVSLSFFPFNNAAIGIITLSIGDPVASLIGLSLNKGNSNPINPKKTIEGTIGGWLISIAICTLFIDPIQVIIGCTAGMFAEMLPINLNDNIIIPITASFISNLI
ncbi:hypothetical protein JW865_00815 [Candidatus Bathyarchaeota archaeon]|nr:hypothetical protein [Candidatus Bathyarchaeota archaeon]